MENSTQPYIGETDLLERASRSPLPAPEARPVSCLLTLKPRQESGELRTNFCAVKPAMEDRACPHPEVGRVARATRITARDTIAWVCR